jgi:excisionase family DNA binding protein
MEKRFLSVEETANYLGMSPRTIYNGVAPKSKKPFPIKPKRVGKLVKFDIKDIDRFMKSA